MPELDLDDAKDVRRDDSGRSPAVFNLAPVACVGARAVDQLVAAAESSGAPSIRLCLHQSGASPLHDMLVLIRRSAYSTPHRHADKDETYHLVRGRGLLAIFDDQGVVTEAHALDPETLFMCRVAAGRFHTLVATTDILVFHESRPGPFTPGGDSIHAPWAPPPTDTARGVAWQEDLIARYSK